MAISENVLAMIARGGSGGQDFQQNYLRGLQARNLMDEQSRAGQARQLLGQYLQGGGQNVLAQLAGADPASALKIKMMEADAAKLPTGVEEYKFGKAQGFPGTFEDWEMGKRRASATNISIDQKAEGEFEKKLATEAATQYGKMAEEGRSATEDLAILGQLRKVMPEGSTMTGLSGKLAEWGIGGAGVSDVQAAQSLIARLIPKQRIPGSGTTSDFDMRMFQQAVPSLWTSPQGNDVVMGTMEALALNKQALGEISNRVMSGEMTRKQAADELKRLPDPMAMFKAYRGQQGAAPGAPPATAQPRATAPQQAKKPPPAPGTVIDGWKFHSGDPSDPQNWERVR